MARCPDCNKFVSLEQEDPEVEVSVDEERAGGKAESSASVTGSVRLALNCGECGTELKEANCDIESEPIPFMHKTADCTGELDVEGEGECADRFEGKGRYAKHFYGADVTLKVTCGMCDAEASGSCSVEEQASSFEDNC